jgi:hypothetical protein
MARKRNPVYYVPDDYDAKSSDGTLTLRFKYKKAKGMVAKHRGITYTVTKPKEFGEHRILRDGYDWMGRKYGGVITAMEIAANIAQATGSKKNKDFDLAPRKNPTLNPAPDRSRALSKLTRM